MDYKQVQAAFADSGNPIDEGMARRIAEALPVAAAVYEKPMDELLATCVEHPTRAMRSLFGVYQARTGLDRLYLGPDMRKIEVFLSTGEYSYTVNLTSDGVQMMCGPPGGGEP